MWVCVVSLGAAFIVCTSLGLEFEINPSGAVLALALVDVRYLFPGI
jgi:hypothetical protein